MLRTSPERLYNLLEWSLGSYEFDMKDSDLIFA